MRYVLLFDTIEVSILILPLYSGLHRTAIYVGNINADRKIKLL